MLQECADHSYFRGETCPFCDKEGRFLMNESEMSWFGRTLTGILRHFPDKFDLSMDENGWVDINDIITNIKQFVNGGGSMYDWTLGCIAVTNAEIEEIWAIVHRGATVKILP